MPSTPFSAPPEASTPDPPRSRRARWILAGIAAFVVLAIGGITWAVLAGNDDGSNPDTVIPAGVRNGGPGIGDVAPDFTLQTLDGKTVSLSDYAGKPVVLNFWASYCTPCRKEFPLFRKELAENPGEFVVLGVDTNDRIKSDAVDFARKQKATWPIAYDADNELKQAYGVGGLPQTFFIKPDGTVALRYLAGIPEDDWADAIAKITQPAKNAKS